MEYSMDRLRFMFRPTTLSYVLRRLKHATNAEITAELQKQYQTERSNRHDALTLQDVERAIEILAVNGKSKDRFVHMYIWLLRRNLAPFHDGEFMVERAQAFLRGIIDAGQSSLFYSPEGDIDRESFFIEFGILDQAAKAAAEEIRNVNQKSTHRKVTG